MTKPILLLAALAIAMPSPLSADPTGDSLVGKSLEAVIGEYGVPDDWFVGAGFIEFSYRAADGGLGKFAFADGVVIAIPAATFQPKQVRDLRKGEVYPGQPVAEAVEILGPVTEYSCGTSALSVRYADGSQALIQDGRVFHSR